MKEYHLKPRDQRFNEIIIGQSLVALVIILVSLYLVFWGFGYKINWQTMKISHTGIVYLSFIPKDAQIKISGQILKDKSPYDAQLLPGYYDISVTKDGYNTWQQHAKIVADKVTWYKNITLFKSNSEVSIISDQNSIASIDSPYDTLVKNPEGNLAFNEHEIWVGDLLITRLSNQISGVIWYPGSQYLAYQQSDEIHMIERDGTNDVLLVKLTSSDKSNFTFSWDGSALLYKDGIVYKRAIIK
ncbi:MAG: PEGA domain-containing protein [Candidatus Berkelbacteria bacterium]|nr:PEGA domain-containing protein [Candidatus Berkelbacteria bacterium]